MRESQSSEVNSDCRRDSDTGENNIDTEDQPNVTASLDDFDSYEREKLEGIQSTTKTRQNPKRKAAQGPPIIETISNSPTSVSTSDTEFQEDIETSDESRSPPRFSYGHCSFKAHNKVGLKNHCS